MIASNYPRKRSSFCVKRSAPENVQNSKLYLGKVIFACGNFSKCTSAKLRLRVEIWKMVARKINYRNWKNPQNAKWPLLRYFSFFWIKKENCIRIMTMCFSHNVLILVWITGSSGWRWPSRFHDSSQNCSWDWCKLRRSIWSRIW